MLTTRPRIRPSLHLALATIFAVLAAGGSSCLLGPDLSGCRIIGGSAHWDETGYYEVTILVENGASEPIDLANLVVEMTTWDAEGHVLDVAYPFSMLGEIARFDNYTFTLPRPDREGRIASSRVVVRDRHGRLVSEWRSEEPI